MIAWLALLMGALVLAFWGRLLATQDEVYALAIYSASSLMAIWGLAIAPSPTPITLGVLALGWVQIAAPKP